ncbi:hypothetical protein F4X88_02280 [Candidatus Poribacteria bacterium]|nr:hypothetical protein [Candidatus Poribacteria bacterium]
MKKSLSRIIAIVCVLIVGGIGLFSLTFRTQAHPKRLDYRHTTYNCYAINGEWAEFCMSYSDSGSRAVWPWAGHQNEDGPHQPHDVESNTHSYDTENYSRSSCNDC